MNVFLRLTGVALVAVLAVGCDAAAQSSGSNAGASPVPSPTSAATAAASEAPYLAPDAPATTAGPAVFDTTAIEGDFALPMKVTLPVGWNPLHDIKGALGLVNMGSPAGPDTTWWGPDLLLVEDAQIHDPSKVVSNEPVKADLDDFIPWPDDFFEYITGLPGVEVVSGPEPVTIGGVQGTQIDVKTPEMLPIVWMAGDYTWLGGGRTGVDPALERRYIVLERGGHTLLIQLGELPSKFAKRDAEVRSILDTITFE
jgi:hypothetical protein